MHELTDKDKAIAIELIANGFQIEKLEEDDYTGFVDSCKDQPFAEINNWAIYESTFDFYVVVYEKLSGTTFFRPEWTDKETDEELEDTRKLIHEASVAFEASQNQLQLSLFETSKPAFPLRE